MERDELKELIHEAVSAVLDERNRVDAEKHTADHAFIALLREKEQRKQEMWISVRKNVIGFLIVDYFPLRPKFSKPKRIGLANRCLTSSNEHYI